MHLISRKEKAMTYAVIYKSESGNTGKIANEIYNAIQSSQKVLCNLEQMTELPKADVYFIGFGIHNMTCGMDVIDLMERIPEGKIALFSTCGSPVSEEYQKKIEKNVKVWIPDELTYLGLFLCQGRTSRRQQRDWLEKSPAHQMQLKRMFELGSSHPDEADFAHAAEFASGIERNNR
jgi:flavodoxin